MAPERLHTCNRLLTTRLQLPMCHALLFALAPPLRRTQNCYREAVSISRTRAMSLRVPILRVHWKCSFAMLIACRCSNTWRFEEFPCLLCRETERMQCVWRTSSALPDNWQSRDSATEQTLATRAAANRKTRHVTGANPAHVGVHV